MKLVLNIIILVSFISNFEAASSDYYMPMSARSLCDPLGPLENHGGNLFSRFENGMIGQNKKSIRHHILKDKGKFLFCHMWALMNSEGVLAFEDQEQVDYFFKTLRNLKQDLVEKRADLILAEQKLVRDLADFEQKEADVIAMEAGYDHWARHYKEKHPGYAKEILQHKSDLVENCQAIRILEQDILSFEAFENYFNNPDNPHYSLQNDKTFCNLKRQNANTGEDLMTKGSRVIEPEKAKEPFWKFWAKK